MRAWSILLLLALALICCWADEQEPEEIAEAPATSLFPRSRLRPKLARPTSAATLPVEDEEPVGEEKEEVSTLPTTIKPRSRSKARSGKSTVPPAPKEDEEGLESSTSASASSTRRPGSKNRNRNRGGRNRSKATSASTASPTEGTTTRSSKRRGSGRRTTTKATTETPVSSSSRSSSRSRNKNGSRTNSRSRSTTSKTPTSLPIEDQTERKGGRNRSKGSNSKSQRRTTTRKPPMTTIPTTITTTALPTTVTLRTTPVEEIELRNIPPIPVQRNPELNAPAIPIPVQRNPELNAPAIPIPVQRNPELNAPAIPIPDEKPLQADPDKMPKLIPDEEITNDKGVPVSSSKNRELQNENPSLSRPRPVRPLPVEGLIVEEPVEFADGMMKDKPIKSPSTVGGKSNAETPLEADISGRSNVDNFRPKPEFEGVPPKLIGPVDSRDLLNSRPVLDDFRDEKLPVKTVPLTPSKSNAPDSDDDEDDKNTKEETRTKLPIQNESLERKGLLPERNEGVPPKPVELVPFHSSLRKTDEIPSKPKAVTNDAELPESSRRFGTSDDDSRFPGRRPPGQPEEDKAVWSFDATIRPNLVSSPVPIRSSNRRTTIPDLSTTPRSKQRSRDSDIKDSKSSSNSRSSSSGRVTPFPIRFEPLHKDDPKDQLDKTKQNAVSAGIPSRRNENIPNPFEEDEEEEEEIPLHRSTSSLKLKSRTEPPPLAENSRNRLRSIPSKETDRIRANQLPGTISDDILSPTTTMRSRTTTERAIMTKSNDDVDGTFRGSSGIQDRSDVAPDIENTPPRILSKEAETGDGFIPLHVKLSFEEESEEDEKITSKPPFEVPPRSRLLAIENSPPRTPAVPKSKLSVDDDPLAVPPAEIRKSQSKKEGEIGSSKNQKGTTTSWSKPIEDEFSTFRHKPMTTERPFVTAPFVSSPAKEQKFSPRIEDDDTHVIPKTDSKASSRNFETNPLMSSAKSASPVSSSGRDRTEEFETGSSRAKKIDTLSGNDKVVSDRGDETISQFESPSFVIRKPVNYVSPPPRVPPKVPEVPVDSEAVASVPSLHSTEVRDKTSKSGTRNEQASPVKSTAFVEQPADKPTREDIFVPEAITTRSPPKTTTPVDETDDYEEDYDDEVLSGP